MDPFAKEYQGIGGLTTGAVPNMTPGMRRVRIVEDLKAYILHLLEQEQYATVTDHVRALEMIAHWPSVP